MIDFPFILCKAKACRKAIAAAVSVPAATAVAGFVSRVQFSLSTSETLVVASVVSAAVSAALVYVARNEKCDEASADQVQEA